MGKKMPLARSLGIALALAMPLGPSPLALPAGQGAAPDPATDPAMARAEAAAETVPALERYLEWCIDERMFARRDAACELILLFDPDHGRARRILGYERGPGGGWERSRYRAREDRAPELLDEAAERRAEALAPYRDALLERYHEGWGEQPVEERRALAAELARIAPEDEEVRGALGHVRHPGRGGWVQAETPLAEERRLEILARARELRADESLARESSPAPAEEDAGLGLEHAAEGRRVRVVGSVGADEVLRCARACEAALALLVELLESKRPVQRAVLHLLDGNERLDALVARRPHLAERVHSSAGTQRVGAWDPKTNELFLWHDAEAQRVEEAVEQCVVWALSRDPGLKDEHGWARVGLVAYVTAAVLGDSSALRPAKRAVLDPAEGRRRAERRAERGEPDPGAWDAALAAVGAAPPPDWGDLLARPASSFDDLERFTAVLLVRFVLEAHAERAPRVFRRVAEGRAGASAFGLPPGARFEDLGERVLGWAREATDLPEPAPELAEVAPAEERRLVREFGDLSRSRRAEVLERCARAARESGARQVALVDEWTRGEELDVGDLPEPAELGPFDASVYRGGPPRREIGPGRSQHDRLTDRLASRAADPRPRPRRVRYEPATGRLVRGDEIEDSELHDLEGLLRGELPEQEWAEAFLLRALDAPGAVRAEAEYFAHTYCDRDAFAYRGVTLFEVWDSRFEHEMPDPDVRAYAIEVWDDDSVPVPLTGADHRVWYPRIARSFERVRDHALTSRALAHLWFGGRRDLERGYDASADLIHATIALEAEDPSRLAERLAQGGTEFLLKAREQITGMGNEGWNAGNERRDELAEDAERMRRAVLAVLGEEGL